MVEFTTDIIVIQPVPEDRAPLDHDVANTREGTRT